MTSSRKAWRRAGGASWRDALVLARGVRAGFGLLKALGYPIAPGAKRLIDSSPVAVLAATLLSPSRVASFREVPATAECRVPIDVMLAAAPLARGPVDVARIEAMRPR